MFGKVSKALLKLKLNTHKYNNTNATWSKQFVRMPHRKANKTHCGKRTDMDTNTGLKLDKGIR